MIDFSKYKKTDTRYSDDRLYVDERKNISEEVFIKIDSLFDLVKKIILLIIRYYKLFVMVTI